MAFSFRGILGQTWKLTELQVGNQRLVREISDVGEIQVGNGCSLPQIVFVKFVLSINFGRVVVRSNSKLCTTLAKGKSSSKEMRYVSSQEGDHIIFSNYGGMIQSMDPSRILIQKHLPAKVQIGSYQTIDGKQILHQFLLVVDLSICSLFVASQGYPRIFFRIQRRSSKLLEAKKLVPTEGCQRFFSSLRLPAIRIAFTSG